MKRNVFYGLFITGFFLCCLSLSADSIRVGQILYEKIYVRGESGKYQILFPDTGEVLEVNNTEIDSSSLVYSPPLERVDLLDKWENTPLQIKAKKEQQITAEQQQRFQQQEDELEAIREQKRIEQDKLDQKIREQQELEQQKLKEQQQKEKEAQERAVAEQRQEQMEAAMLLIAIVVGAIAGFLIYFLPTIIAAVRKHHYLWVIFGINLIFGLSGIGYFIALIWAVWPKKTAVFDVITNDPTSNSTNAGSEIYGKMGSNVRAFKEALNSQATSSTKTSAQSITFKDSTIRIYVHVNDQVKGPYTTGQICSLLNNGKLNYDSLVCQEGTETWLPVSSFLK